LASHFVRRFAARLGRRYPAISPEAWEYLMSHHWAGNVRELQNVLQRAVLIANADSIRPEHIVIGATALSHRTR
jgi:DNA-binding NtrC family response regulator